MSFHNEKLFLFFSWLEFDATLQVLLKIYLQDDMSGESENFVFMMSNVEIQFCQISPKANRYSCCCKSYRQEYQLSHYLHFHHISFVIRLYLPFLLSED